MGELVSEASGLPKIVKKTRNGTNLLLSSKLSPLSVVLETSKKFLLHAEILENGSVEPLRILSIPSHDEGQDFVYLRLLLCRQPRLQINDKCSTAQGRGAGAATTENLVIAQDTLSSKMIEWADNDQLKEWFLLILLYSACHQSFQTKDQVQLSETRYQFIL